MHLVHTGVANIVLLQNVLFSNVYNFISDLVFALQDLPNSQDFMIAWTVYIIIHQWFAQYFLTTGQSLTCEQSFLIVVMLPTQITFKSHFVYRCLNVYYYVYDYVFVCLLFIWFSVFDLFVFYCLYEFRSGLRALGRYRSASGDCRLQCFSTRSGLLCTGKTAISCTRATVDRII